MKREEDQQHIGPTRLRSAIRDSVIALSLGTILQQILFQGGVIQLLVLSLGGTEIKIGLISMIVNFSMVMGIFTIPYLEVRPRKELLHFWLMISVCAALLFFLLHPVNTLFGPVSAYWFLAAAVFVSQSARMVATSFWMPYLADLIPPPLRGRYFGRMRRLLRIASLSAILLAGFALGTEPDMWRFYLIFIVGIFLQAIRLVYTRRLPSIPSQRTGEAESLWENLRRPFGDTDYRRYLLFLFFVYLINTATTPFMVPYLRVDLGFPASHTVYTSACIALGSIISLVLWGNLADRRGSRFVFLLSIVAMAASFLSFVLLPVGSTRGYMYAAAAFGFLLRGISLSGLGIAYTLRTMNAAKKSYRGSYITVARFIVGISATIGPLTGGILLEHLPGETTVAGSPVFTKRIYFLVMCCTMLSLVFLIKLLRPLAEKRTREIVRNMIYTSLIRLNSQLSALGRMFGKEEPEDSN